MFKKPIKVKSNSQIKASDRKKFKDLLLKTFPSLTEDQLNEYLPKKETVNSLKVITSDNIIVQVYTFQKKPIAFETKGKLYPSVYFLWQFPDLTQYFTTHEQVTQYLYSGADLMLPGVITPSSQTGLPKYGSVMENEIVYINLNTNKAAIAVGVACQSSGGMSQANGKGKCVNVVHYYQDNLCSVEDTLNCPLPSLGPPDWLTMKSFEEEFPALGKTKTEVEVKEEVQEVEEFQEEESEISMDELLTYCFLGALKYSKNLTLPALTSNFFKLHMLPLCPPGKSLDIKKTSFKKLKTFLEKMSKDGVVTVKEIKKGVEAITEINKEHEMFAQLYIKPENRPKKEVGDNEGLIKTDVVESYIITQNLVPIFEGQGHKKGDVVQPNEVRKCVTTYVRNKNLQDETNVKLVKPDEILKRICKTESAIPWEEVIEKVTDSLKNCYKVKSGVEEITAKGKISPVTITVSTRSGNKKVTLIDNLELFGIKINDFAKECQHGVAASTSVSRPPGKKTDQLLVQGNQVLFVYNLLVDKYKVPKKYVKGLEFAPKKK